MPILWKTLFQIALALILAACASTVLDRKTFKSYTIGATATAAIGDAFLVDQGRLLLRR